jgi:hypothetical protein
MPEPTPLHEPEKKVEGDGGDGGDDDQGDE